jgi:ABC-type Zn uptake system ZnuABC Zn-binding protein ZnuA
VGLRSVGLRSVGLRSVGLRGVGLRSVGLRSVGLRGVGLRGALLGGLSCALALLGCARQAPTPAGAGAAALAATTPTLETFARRLLEQDLELSTPLPPGEDPARWMPDDAALALLQAAGLVLCQGAGYEPWLESASLSRSRLVETARAVEASWIEFETVTHSHGAGEHSHAGLRPQTWLDPLLAREQARAAAAAIARRWPDLKARLEPRLAALQAELEALDRDWRGLAPRLMRARLLCSHPSYAYLARRYGLALESVLIEPDRPLDAEGLAGLAAVRGAGPGMVWFEFEPIAELSAQLEREFGLLAVHVDPVDIKRSSTAGEADALQRQTSNLERLAAALVRMGL